MHEYLKFYSPLTMEQNSKMSAETREQEILAEDRIHRHFASYTAVLLRLLDPETILAVIYAALVWLREAIAPMDIYMWIINGDLPYLKLQTFQSKAEGLFKEHLPKIVFMVKCPPSPFHIERGGTRLAADIGLKLPPVNVPLHIMRLTKTLCLRDSIGEQAVALYRYYWRGSGFDEEKIATLYYPAMVPLSCILAAMKLIYGLDDAQRQVEGNVDWMAWAEERWRTCIYPTRKHRPDCKALMEMPPSELKLFAAFVNDDLLCGHEVRRSYNTTERRLGGLIKKWKNDPVSEEVKAEFPSRPKRSAVVEFGLGKDVNIVPPLYHLPCQTYWFIDVFEGGSALHDNDFHFPVDFLAVLSVLTAIQNVKPGDMLACLASLERKMLQLDLNCMKYKRNLKITKEKARIHITTGGIRKHIRQALRDLEYPDDDIQRILTQEKKLVEVWDSDKDHRKRKHSETTGQDPLDSVERQKSSVKTTAVNHPSINLSRDQLNQSEGPGMRQQWTENAEEILKQARLAVDLNQPIAALGARYMRKGGLHFSQTWSNDSRKTSQAFMDDVSDLEDEDTELE